MTTPSQDSRRGNDQALMQLVQQIHESQILLEKRLTEHMSLEPKEIAKEIAILMEKAFPEGDPDGHRRHHELVIQREEEKTEFWKKMRVEIGKWGLISLLGFLAVSVWQGVLTEFHKW